MIQNAVRPAFWGAGLMKMPVRDLFILRVQDCFGPQILTRTI